MKPCTSCRRHLRRSERHCPFCGAPAREVAAPLAAVLSLSVVLGGCTDEPLAETTGEDLTTTRGSDSSTSSLSGSGVVEGSTGSFDATTTGEDSTMDTSSGGGFIYGGADDSGQTAFECDLFLQDCPLGDKCMPWANDGGGAWNATRCTPVDERPGGPGDSCFVEGSGVSGIDDCELGAMCWDVNPETVMGTCVALCTGTIEDPVCEDPDTVCVVANGGIIVVCLELCDPLTQDCESGHGCFPVEDGFVCSPDVSQLGAYGDPCGVGGACWAGLLCMPAEATPGCESSACCTEFCSLGDPSGDAQCTGAPEGQQCVPYFEDGSAPPPYVDVGFCSLPS